MAALLQGAAADGGGAADGGAGGGVSACGFHGERHVAYVRQLSADRDSFEYVVTEHLRMSGVYWGLSAMATMGRDLRADMDTPALCDWVMRCWDPHSGGFAGNEGHDPHMLYTLSAVQILVLAGELDDRLPDERKDAVARYVGTLQQPDGSFVGDQWGEVDTRFSYCALNCLALLRRLPRQREEAAGEGEPFVDVDKAADYVLSCMNFDGGFGAIPGAESHAGQIFCCVGALSIAGALDRMDADLLGWWLCERQCDSGGLNGRPEKQADVCYSWWILSSLSIMNRVSWIDVDKLVEFIVNCQDAEDGGVADRPGNVADVFHTFFGIAGLSLLGFFDQHTQDHEGFATFRSIDPTYALPMDIVEAMDLPRQTLPPPVEATPAAAVAASAARETAAEVR